MRAVWSRQRLAVVGGIVVLIILTVVATVFLTRREAEPGDAAGDAAAVAAELRAATADLVAAPAVRYTGSFSSAAERRPGVVMIDAVVTGKGAVLGELKVEGRSASLMAVGEHTMIRAGSRFWGWARSLGDPGDRWVVLHDGFFGFDLGARLHPSALLASPSPEEAATRLDPTVVGGVEVRPVRWRGTTYAISAADPKRLVRLSSTDTPPGLDLKPAPLEAPERAKIVGVLRREARTLTDAREFGAQPDFAGRTPTAFKASEVTSIRAELEAA